MDQPVGVAWRWILVVVIATAIVALIAFARGRTQHGHHPTVHTGPVVSAQERPEKGKLP